MSIGTKSVLFGAHCFFVHPLFVAAAWIKLYGFPWDPRIWLAFFLHDIGYLGKPNIDGPEGERHVLFGANLMYRLTGNNHHWWAFCAYHSRHWAKRNHCPPSRLCFADKLSFALTPSWLYLPMVNATGEIFEYLNNARRVERPDWVPVGDNQHLWHAQLCSYMRQWVAQHKDGAVDTWTEDRHYQ